MSLFSCILTTCTIVILNHGLVNAVPITPTVTGMCDDGTWTKFQDTKCYKLVDKFNTYDGAKAACTTYTGQTPAQLAKIESIFEQEFLTTFVFNISGVVNNVWIGATRSTNPEHSNRTFVWSDGEIVSRYKNWHTNRPTDDSGKKCVEIQSGDTEETVGKWKDVNCMIGNWAICEKYQVWNNFEIQQAILLLRQNPPVPIGFLYFEVHGQPAPASLWSHHQWEDVSSKYAGLFFRIVGGEASEFGKIQGGNTNRITQVEEGGKGYPPHLISLPAGAWSPWVSMGEENSINHYASRRYYTSGGEIRPRNMAIRIWKRIA